MGHRTQTNHSAEPKVWWRKRFKSWWSGVRPAIAGTWTAFRGEPGAAQSALSRWRRSLVAKTAVTLIMFSVIPAFIYLELSSADRERNLLLLEAGQEHGRVLAAALAPYLRAGLSEQPALNGVLEQLASTNLNVRVIFRPNGDPKEGFYYIAAFPAIAPDIMESERRRISDLGILNRLDLSCKSDKIAAIRHRHGDGNEYLITSITPLRTDAGCWAVIASYTNETYLQSSLGMSYWQTPQIQIAAVLYLAVAAVAVFLLLRVRDQLLKFRGIAVNVGPHAGAMSLAEQNVTPELDDVAAEFDRIVERLAMLSFAVENSPVAIVVAADDWRIEYANPAFSDLTGYVEADTIGRTPAVLLATENDASRWEAICRTVEKGEVWHGDIAAHRVDGGAYWADMSVYPLSHAHSGIRRFVVIQQDVSERRAILAKLTAARGHAEEANRSKSEFLAQMSHELRTPLNAIMGFSEVLADPDLYAGKPHRIVEYARHIHESGAHLLAVINDLLDLAKLEAGKTKLHRELLDLTNLIGSTVALVAPQAQAAGVRLDWEDNTMDVGMASFDERAMRQILLNLLSNAIKFTPPQGVVTVGLRRENSLIELRIADTGCGIRAEDVPRILEPYAQVDDAARTREGTGLGLPIVKGLVELHGADMAIESEVGVGTIICLYFPTDGNPAAS